jgi:hypothetical protein
MPAPRLFGNTARVPGRQIQPRWHLREPPPRSRGQITRLLHFDAHSGRRNDSRHRRPWVAIVISRSYRDTVRSEARPTAHESPRDMEAGECGAGAKTLTPAADGLSTRLPAASLRAISVPALAASAARVDSLRGCSPSRHAPHIENRCLFVSSGKLRPERTTGHQRGTAKAAF